MTVIVGTRDNDDRTLTAGATHGSVCGRCGEGRLEVRSVPGNHDSLLYPPHVSATAEAVMAAWRRGGDEKSSSQ
eukprot:4429154-Pyramimonas_sp.AAC.1